MTDEQIRAAILADPQLRAAIEFGNDQAVADALSAVAARIPTGELYTERSLFAELGPVMGESVLSKLEQFATSGNSGASVVARGLRWLQPANGGLDFQHLGVRQMLTGLQVAGVLSQTELDAVLLLGTRPGVVSIAQVANAVSQWRPDGKIQPIPEV